MRNTDLKGHDLLSAVTPLKSFLFALMSRLFKKKKLQQVALIHEDNIFLHFRNNIFLDV